MKLKPDKPYDTDMNEDFNINIELNEKNVQNSKEAARKVLTKG